MSFSLFSTPQPQQPQSLFQPQQQQSSPFFQQPQQQLIQQTQHQQQQQQQQQQQHFYLFTNDKAPASYGTKWADLHPDSQKVLLQIEERILEYRDESQRLDQCSRLYDSSVSNDAFEPDASHVVQELGGISTSMDRQKIVLQELMAAVKDMLRNTEVAIRSFMILRQRFHHSGPGIGSSVTAPSQPPGAPMTSATNSQPPTASLLPIFDFYNGLPRKPSPFLQHTVNRFEKYLGECRQWIEEIEQLILLNSDKNFDSSSSLLQSFPKVMSNVHDFFLHVAAKVESIHQYIESMKTAYLADLRRRGDGHDPFLEADRRATARQEAAAKRVHPTLHLPPVSQPSNQVARLSATPGISNAPQTAAAVTSALTGSGLSLFGTPSSAPAATPSLFTTPSAAAPTSSVFGQSAASSQTSLFGSASGSLFGSASTPSLFASSAPAFGSTPSTGGLFSTPFASGAAVGSGASFGATSKQRPKSRGGSGRR